jgi:hypothetical protein
MPSRIRLGVVLAVAAGVLPPLAGNARAQTSPRNPQRSRAIAQQPPNTARKGSDARADKVPTTLIHLELLTGPEANSLKAADWQKACDQLKIPCTIRRGLQDDQPGITEKKRGDSFRQLQIVGRLDKTGRLVFPDRAFAPGDSRRLAEWIEELKTYGAQGTPEGQRLWGLSEKQFTSVMESLSKPLAIETEEVALKEVLAGFQFTDRHPLRWTAQAEQKRSRLDPEATCAQSVRGFTQGTALALVLAEVGLGFRPRRLPDGSIDLAVVELDEAAQVWPIGWYRNIAPADAAPPLFVFREIHFSEIDVEGVLAASTAVTGIPVLVDRPNLRAKEIDLASHDVDFPLRRTTWAQAYDRILGKALCKYELLIDEAGHPFVWITSLQTPNRRP